MQSITVNTILRQDRPKDGLFPVYLRIIAGRKKIDVRVNYYVAESDLLPNGSVKKSCFNSYNINQAIQSTYTEINNIIIHHRLNEMHFTSASFRLFYKKDLNNCLLAKYIRSESAKMNICDARYRTYKVLANHIEKYFPKITVNDVDFNFLTHLEKVFLNDLNFCSNTVSGSMSRLKAILNQARKQKIIKNNPFENYKIKGYTSNRQFLTKEELLQFEEYYSTTANDARKNACAIFLFLCYTGIRGGDFMKLTPDHIADGGINLIQSKTGAFVFVPLSAPALRFLNDDRSFSFYKISQQKINRHLSTVATEIGLKKPVSCHVARHTFATLSLTLKMDLTVISKVLGHAKIATTMIYAKVLNESKKQEVAKWDNFLGF